MKRIINLLLMMTVTFAGYSQVEVDVELQRAENVIQKNLSSVQPEYTPEQIYEIPVVFHVLHKGEYLDVTPNFIEQPYSTNISYQQLVSSIDNLTDRFRNTWVPYWEDADEEANRILPISVDAGIEFRLATRDPNGNPTSGIIRHDMSSDANYMENGLVTTQTSSDLTYNMETILQETGWPREQYLNIWVVSEINNNNGGCGTTGIGTFPTETLEFTDGVIVQWNKIGYGGFANLSPGGSLAEHIGSYLGLYQTWRNTPTCEAANAESDCSSQGDMVCDTPPTPRNCSSMCSSRCTSPNGEPSQLFYPDTINIYPDTYNYMDDTGTNCKRRFTQGQVDRMRTTLETLRSGLISYAWTQQVVHNLGVSVHLNRVGYNKYQPTVILENSGDFDEDTWDITVSVAEDANLTHTISSADLGPIRSRSLFNIKFPIIQLVDAQAWNINAALTSANDEYASDNTSSYALTKTVDGYVKVDVDYTNTFGDANGYYGRITIVDADTDEVILDGRKFWGSRWSSNHDKNTFENKKILKYGRDLYGRAYRNVVGLDRIKNYTANWNTEDYYYLPPGNYQVRISSAGTWMNGPKAGQGILFQSKVCQDGCHLGVSYNEEAAFYYIDETSDEYDPDPIYGGIYFSAGAGDTPADDYVAHAFNFTIPNDFVSNEPSCLPENVNGICLETESNTLPTFSISEKYLSAKQASVAVQVNNNGYMVIDSARVLLSENSQFTSIVKDTLIRINAVSEDWAGVQPENEVLFSNLTSETQYWAKVEIAGFQSDPINFTTFANACEDQNTITYNGDVYDIVNMGNQCWFAENLRTNSLNDGTPIVDATVDRSLWSTQNDLNSPVFAYNNFNGQVDFDNSILGNLYNGWTVQTGKLCPTGWRVSSHWDWKYVDDITGNNTRQKLLAEDSSPQGNSFRTAGIKGTNAYGFSMQSAGQVIKSDGDNYGFPAMSYWTKNEFSETAYGGPQPEGTFMVNDLTGVKVSISYQERDREMQSYWRTQSERESAQDNVYVVSPDTYSYANILDAFDWGQGVRCVKGQSAPEVIVGNMIAIEQSTGNSSWRPQYCNFDITANVHNDNPLVFDECGTCGGTGIPVGFCDCEGNIPDAIGICGGDCDEDADGDGICDNVNRIELDGCEPVEMDGYTYSVVGIGDQCWFAENLKTTVFANGESVGYETDSETWSASESALSCHYNNDPVLDATLGKLYNWYAVNDSRGLCPTGWHVPSDNDWKELETAVQVPRSELNSKGYRGLSTNSGDLLGPSSTTGFSGEYAGIRVSNDGNFREIGTSGYFWTSDSFFTTRNRYRNSAWHRGIFDNVSGIGRYHDTWQTSDGKGHGLSVRCIKD